MLSNDQHRILHIAYQGPPPIHSTLLTKHTSNSLKTYSLDRFGKDKKPEVKEFACGDPFNISFGN